jgi:hypothetical protein
MNRCRVVNSPGRKLHDEVSAAVPAAQRRCTPLTRQPDPIVAPIIAQERPAVPSEESEEESEGRREENRPAPDAVAEGENGAVGNGDEAAEDPRPFVATYGSDDDDEASGEERLALEAERDAGAAGEGADEEAGDGAEGRRREEVEVRETGEERERREGGRGSAAGFSFS